MARNDTVTFSEGVWEELTANDVSEITFQNQSSGGISVKATVGAVTPTDAAGAFDYNQGEGEFSLPLSQLAPGIAANRVFVRANSSGGRVTVSHA